MEQSARAAYGESTRPVSGRGWPDRRTSWRNGLPGASTAGGIQVRRCARAPTRQCGPHAPLDARYGKTVDFGDVKRLFKPLFGQLDHQSLYEIADFADCDTASIARWVLEQARAELPQFDRVDLYETPGCGAIVGDAVAPPLG